MKKNELTNFRTKKEAELRASVLAKKHELLLFYAKIVSGGEKNLKKGRNIKRDIAQMLTLARQKELTKKKQVKTETDKEVKL